MMAQDRVPKIDSLALSFGAVFKAESIIAVGLGVFELSYRLINGIYPSNRKSL